MHFSIRMYLGSNNVYFGYFKKCTFYSTKMFITIMVFFFSQLINLVATPCKTLNLLEKYNKLKCHFEGTNVTPPIYESLAQTRGLMGQVSHKNTICWAK